VARWFDLMVPMNQKFFRIWPMKEWVDDAYNKGIEFILANPELAKWKYVLTIEADNVPPPNALLLLLESIQKFDVVGGLYWTKGELGQPMIYGDPKEMPFNFRPQKPLVDTLQECNGLGMGFTLFKLDIFKDPRIPRPWFKTEQQYQYGVGARSYTQDLYFFERAKAVGYKIACDTRVRVGHYDAQADRIW
jgi:glycosyltransferase involved in cell wall biosynthesis